MAGSEITDTGLTNIYSEGKLPTLSHLKNWLFRGEKTASKIWEDLCSLPSAFLVPGNTLGQKERHSVIKGDIAYVPFSLYLLELQRTPSKVRDYMNSTFSITQSIAKAPVNVSRINVLTW